MSDFIFSVNVTFPIFLVMVIGWVLHQIGMLDEHFVTCLLYTSPSPRDRQKSRMPSSA